MTQRLFILIASSFLLLGTVLSSCGGLSRRDATTVSEDSGDRRLNQYEKARPAAEGAADEDVREEESDESENEPAAPRMVIYQGRMQVQVVQPNATLQKLTGMVKEEGGIIERTNFEDEGRRVLVVLRIPVAKFFAMMDRLPELGTVLSRSIQASDITKEFADVENRLKSAKILKQRLEKLLATVKNVEEKVKILREINRLATEIETLSARSKDLSSRASMSTIVLQLMAEPRSTSSPELRSPFAQVRGLNPAQRSIRTRSSIRPQKPEGFFDNERGFADGAPHHFYSPDGTILRSGEVKNRPTGDAAFWKKAFEIEFQKRSYKPIQSQSVDGGHLFLFRIHDGLNIYYYGMSYRVTGATIQVYEAFSPREAAYKKDGTGMLLFLKSIAGGKP